jgi:hypothetical protein
MNIYIDRTRDGKIAVEAGGKMTVFDDRAEAEAFARKKRGRTLSLLMSTLEPPEEEPVPRAAPADPKDRVRVTVEPVTFEGPKRSAYAVYRVTWQWRREKRVIATFVADPTKPESNDAALEHARQFAKETQAQIEWEAS